VTRAEAVNAGCPSAAGAAFTRWPSITGTPLTDHEYVIPDAAPVAEEVTSTGISTRPDPETCEAQMLRGSGSRTKMG
jgi:hypothetical protein